MLYRKNKQLNTNSQKLSANKPSRGVILMKTIILIISFSVFLSLNVWGSAYEDIGSVRARGMGDAYESISGDIDSVYYNPAGTAHLRSLQMMAGYGKPAVGFDDESSFNNLYFGYGAPFSTEPYLIPIHYLFKGLTVGNEQFLVRDASFTFLYHDFSVSDFAYERLFTFNYSKNLNNLIAGANLSAGLNVNLYNRGFTHTEDTEIHPDTSLNNTATGLGLDFGLLYDFSRYIRLSFVLGNILEPNISFFSDGKEYVNGQLKGGLAWRLGKQLYMHDMIASIGLVQISRDSEDTRKPETIYKIGWEFWPVNDAFALRFGYKTQFNVVTAGLSYKQNLKKDHNLIVNLAFNYPFESENYKIYGSLNYQFEFPDYYFDYRVKGDLEDENEEIEENYRKGLVVLKYKTRPNDNLYNISLIHYGNPNQTKLLKKHNEIEDESSLPTEMEIPYAAKSFELYRTKPGDTLESISVKYFGTQDKTGKILKYNKVPYSKLRVGRVLVIPQSKEDKKRRAAEIRQEELERKAEAKRKAEEKKAVEMKKRMEEKKKLEEKRAAEVKKKAEERKKAEVKRKAEAKKKAEAKRKAAAKKKAEVKKKAEAKKKAAEIDKFDKELEKEGK